MGDARAVHASDPSVMAYGSECAANERNGSLTWPEALALIRNSLLSLGVLFRLERRAGAYATTAPRSQFPALILAWLGCQECPIRPVRRWRCGWMLGVRPYRPEAHHRVRSPAGRTERCL